MAKIVVVKVTTPSGAIKNFNCREAVTFDVTGQGSLILYGDHNSKTSKMPVVAFAVGKWDQAEVVEES